MHGIAYTCLPSYDKEWIFLSNNTILNYTTLNKIHLNYCGKSTATAIVASSFRREQFTSVGF